MKIVILAGGPAQNFEELIAEHTEGTDTFFVGVDRGAYRLMQAGLPVHLAIGDFDSLTAQEFSEVQAYAEDLQQSPAEKDDTDLELAVLTATVRFPNASEILILGGLGGRFDHGIQIFYLVLQARFSELLSKITLLDAQNVIKFVGAGHHVLTKLPEMTYLAFASLTPVIGFSIKAAKYELKKTDFPSNFSLSSNEFVADNPVSIDFETGIVAVIQSRD
ncbi:thiamine pyrophosphokinase [Bacilli bacterium]|nr:thiamine pyrophosphokinase [Bacilli bacterium]GHU44431.1 thiamine pyrophosphokinase [Bacilli bacterium]GHU46136.1 thiamine pyrophosphokinase [Bacilli bacterium]